MYYCSTKTGKDLLIHSLWVYISNLNIKYGWRLRAETSSFGDLYTRPHTRAQRSSMDWSSVVNYTDCCGPSNIYNPIGNQSGHARFPLIVSVHVHPFSLWFLSMPNWCAIVKALRSVLLGGTCFVRAIQIQIPNLSSVSLRHNLFWYEGLDYNSCLNARSSRDGLLKWGNSLKVRKL